MRGIPLTAALLLGLGGIAIAQVPTIDEANLEQARQIASATSEILSTDRNIMNYTQATLQAVTGDRSGEAGQLAQIALGNGGFSMGSAPSLGSVISGGSLSFAGLGNGSQGMVSNLINGLQLVKTISGLINGQTTQMDKNYSALVNVAATVTGLVDSSQNGVKTRSSAFQSGAQRIGTAQDIKGSIDQNSQIMVQTGLTVNELIGAVNTATAAANQENIDRMNLITQATRGLEYKSGQ
ncbi:type IV secretion system protein [Mesorhizobium amorphae]|uniref:Conjugal transfer protein n=1 Tax=Mesorhizobium amorphae CCNWGS0123 TaxID=1082933 RepID=G6YJ68_9HYPH|nr:type IV secretion system protein [Mesorhizobium amorphae]ANT54309.1 conjugal transfer protein [Mesorhizobium amorphae CCNWGS0123]EHH05200.1 conjugal transfer protein [Mesorhizobium amorphae CCNWGS0123]